MIRLFASVTALAWLIACSAEPDDDAGETAGQASTRQPGLELEAKRLKGRYVTFTRAVDIPSNAARVVLAVSDVVESAVLTSTLECAITLPTKVAGARVIDPAFYKIAAVTSTAEQSFTTKLRLTDLDSRGNELQAADFSIECTGLTREPLTSEIEANLKKVATIDPELETAQGHNGHTRCKAYRAESCVLAIPLPLGEHCSCAGNPGKVVP
jgi:hypothetical protein